MKYEIDIGVNDNYIFASKIGCIFSVIFIIAGYIMSYNDEETSFVLVLMLGLFPFIAIFLFGYPMMPSSKVICDETRIHFFPRKAFKVLHLSPIWPYC